MKKRTTRNIGIYVLIFALVMGMAFLYNRAPRDESKEIEYSELVEYIAKEEVKELSVDNNKMVMTAKLKNGEEGKAVYTLVDYSILSDKYLNQQAEDGKLKLTAEAPKTTPWYISLLPTLLMVLLLVFFWVMIMNQQGGGGKAMQFGRSKAHLMKDSDLRKITFKDVAGLDEEKEELSEIVEFLRHPKRFASLGARIPKGVLLVGSPGTGKTYISKATAGEAGVPFFTISGSEFVEMFVGVGASRVRDLFDQAKKNAPCIVFIDEIDAVGRKRGAGLGGGNDEREQTLNQLLVEMDGFEENSGIIILAATNRPDVLDPALLRPGRFDRQIVIGMPDIKGREEIFRVHSRNKPLAEGVDPKVLARRTPGFSPADIENMLNEAALLTARRNGKAIRMDEIEEAITKVIAGPEKKSRVISEKERKLTAFHEAGHAVVARSLPNTDPVHQVTIVPRGMAGGFTMTLPQEDRYYGTKQQMREEIIHLLGGRVAEKLTLEDISTGASNDIQRATDVAREMVTKYGFSEKLGPINYSGAEEVFLGKDFSTRQNYSEEVAALIDSEIRRIVEECFQECERILTEHMEELTRVAHALLAVETIDGEQFEDLYTGKLTAEEIAAQDKAKDEAIAKANEEERREMEALQAVEEADPLGPLYDEDYTPDARRGEYVADGKHDEYVGVDFGGDDDFFEEPSEEAPAEEPAAESPSDEPAEEPAVASPAEEPAAEDNAAVEIEDGFVPAEEADEDSKEEE